MLSNMSPLITNISNQSVLFVKNGQWSHVTTTLLYEILMARPLEQKEKENKQEQKAFPGGHSLLKSFEYIYPAWFGGKYFGVQ